ncbi:MAG TPA: biotin/lipoate A/B protein ligase family protein [Anaerolineales bacterium]|nr:biotin/lipoate A/B protein ligase family protein [Anaerolineales bacterium]
MKPIRLLSLGPTDWLRTQSVYHALAKLMTRDAPDTIVLARPLQPYLCIGYHQELASVLDRAVCAQMGLPIVRRRVGGGATYLDRQQLFYQCVFHHTRVPAMVGDVYARLLAAPVATLRVLGLAAELRGENEIEVNGKRIAGIGGGRIGEAAVVVGNLLFDFDYEAMTRAWRVPSESFRRLASEALRERVTTLRAELPRRISPAEARSSLIDEFTHALGRPVKPGELTLEERRTIEELDRRLVSEEWLSLHANGAKPMAALKISRGVFIRAAEADTDGCHVRASFRVRDDRIEQAVLESEPERDWGGAIEKLRGVKLGEWVSAVERQP